MTAIVVLSLKKRQTKKGEPYLVVRGEDDQPSTSLELPRVETYMVFRKTLVERIIAQIELWKDNGDSERERVLIIQCSDTAT